MKTKTLTTIVALLLLAIMPSAEALATTPTASEIIARTANGFKKSKTVTAKFTMSGNMGSTSGSFQAAGGRFAFVTTMGGTWFNGKSMWTYNPQTRETTLVKPTQQEIAESNPFSAISVFTTDYTAAYAKQQPAGKIVVVLRAKSTKNNIKKIVLTLDSKRLVPVKMVVTDKSGTSTINVSSYVVGPSISATAFEYPKSRFPKAKIKDLR